MNKIKQVETFTLLWNIWILTGYDFQKEEDLDEIEAAYKKAGIHKNIWQGDEALELYSHGNTRLKKCIAKREENSSYIGKVYVWTVKAFTDVEKALQ